MTDLITTRFKLKEIFPNIAAKMEKTLKEHDVNPEEAEFIRKGIIPRDMRFEEGENAVVSYITTNTKDRDGEVIEPKGAMLEDYLKNPVVLFGHDYWSMPIGKCVSIKKDNKGLIAKTVYYNKGLGQEVFEYRKAGFPLAESIGFIPLEWTDYSKNDGTDESKDGVRRRYTKWNMLEYSDVSVPSNPEAIMLAVSKGLMPVKIADVDKAGNYTMLLESEDKYIHFNDKVDKNRITQVLMDFGGLLQKEDFGSFDIDEFCEKNKVEIYEKSETSFSFPDIKSEATEEKSEDEVIIKKVDMTGNPSVWDITEAIQALITPPIGLRWTKWVCDIYPVKYPDGHVIICDDGDGKNKYYQFDYTFKEGAATLSDKYIEIESVYKPKGFFAKSGREFSAKNIKAIKTVIDNMQSAVIALKAMLNEVEQPVEEAISDVTQVKTTNTPRKLNKDEISALFDANGDDEVTIKPRIINATELKGLFSSASEEILRKSNTEKEENTLRSKGVVQIP